MRKPVQQEEIIGKSLKSLEEDDFRKFFIDENDDVEARISPTTVSPASFLGSYLASEALDCGSD